MDWLSWPENQWGQKSFDPGRFSGGQVIEAAADISSIPVFVKAGSIIPTTEPAESTAATEGQEIRAFEKDRKDTMQ